MEFEWDTQKAKTNLQKHGISFTEAATVFRDPFSVDFPDPEHSIGEDRYILIGMSRFNRILVILTEICEFVSLAPEKPLVRTRQEQRFYEEGR